MYSNPFIISHNFDSYLLGSWSVNLASPPSYRHTRSPMHFFTVHLTVSTINMVPDRNSGAFYGNQPLIPMILNEELQYHPSKIQIYDLCPWNHQFHILRAWYPLFQAIAASWNTRSAIAIAATTITKAQPIPLKFEDPILMTSLYDPTPQDLSLMRVLRGEIQGKP